VIEDLWISGNPELEAWRTAPLPDLVNHILEHYHLGARLEMARMETFVEQACLMAGDEEAPQQLRNEIARFCRDFRAHMTMEERTLFPHFLDPGQNRKPASPQALVHPLKKLLEDEHLAEVALFQDIRDIATSSARNLPLKLRQSLRAMEKSLYAHIFLESQVLFRRAP
jgi:regulator of cell morphogenesis and NO signaling